MWNDLNSPLRELGFRLRALFRRSAEETELNDELRFHFEQQVAKYRLAGMTEEEARQRARLAFGGHEQVKEDCREARGTSFVENARQDLRYAARQLRESYVCGGDCAHAGAEYRGEQRHLQRDRQRADQAAAVPAAGEAGADLSY